MDCVWLSKVLLLGWLVFALVPAASLLKPESSTGLRTPRRGLHDLIAASPMPPASTSDSDWVTYEKPKIVNTNAPDTSWSDLTAVPEGTPAVSEDTCAANTWNTLCNSCVSMSLSPNGASSPPALSCTFDADSDMKYYDKPMCCSEQGASTPPGSDGLTCCKAPGEGKCADVFGSLYPYEHCCMSDRCVGS